MDYDVDGIWRWGYERAFERQITFVPLYFELKSDETCHFQSQLLNCNNKYQHVNETID